jgi:hypothetical protein
MIETIMRGLPVQPLLDVLKPAWWHEITARQQFPGTAHKDTQTIFLRGPHSFFSYFEPDAKDYPRVADVIGPLMQVLRPLFGFMNVKPEQVGRVLVVKLKPGGHVAEHTDEGDYADTFTRLHVILSTNDACWYRCGDVVASYPTGTAFWFDHKQPHEAFNGGETERIHLIIDVLKPWTK